MGQDSQVKHFDHVGGSHAPLDAESQVLTGELINDVTDLEHAPLPIRIKLEINGPHLPRSASLDQAPIRARAWLRSSNMLSSKSSSRMRLCKDSTNPPSHGWPGGMNA